jgi:hypothetical protein
MTYRIVNPAVTTYRILESRQALCLAGLLISAKTQTGKMSLIVIAIPLNVKQVKKTRICY